MALLEVSSSQLPGDKSPGLQPRGAAARHRAGTFLLALCLLAGPLLAYETDQYTGRLLPIADST